MSEQKKSAPKDPLKIVNSGLCGQFDKKRQQEWLDERAKEKKNDNVR